jgi:cyclopropane-fatty-acyl-phospholipid synthase
MEKLFFGLLERITRGKVTVQYKIQEFVFGRDDTHSITTGFPFGTGHIVLRVKDPKFFSKVVSLGNLGLGESYMAGDFEILKGSLHEFLYILLVNRVDKEIKVPFHYILRLLWLYARNQLRGANHNVPKHYDLGNDLFLTFLDDSLTYSCGYLRNESDSLEQIQQNKLSRICSKLRLTEADHLLDIGCGYGSMLLHAAKHFGTTGYGITLSANQMYLGNQRIRDAGLSNKLSISIEDIRTTTHTADKIVSVGMMEHIPKVHYSVYFQKIARLLKPGGLGLVHTIGCNSKDNRHDPFIQKYIFPGSRTPRLSEIAMQLERHGLHILDVENIVRHYGYTAYHWLQRFQLNKGELDPAKYNESFVRLWEYYLSCAVAAPFGSDSAVYQVLFTNDYTMNIPTARV